MKTAHTLTKTANGYVYRGVQIARRDGGKFAVVGHNRYGWYYVIKQSPLNVCVREIDRSLDDYDFVAYKNDLHTPDSQWLTK